MLINFSVTNFRSIKEKQTISLETATKYHKETNKELKHNLFNTKEITAPELLKSAVIYGANASGKTSLIRAVYAFNHVFMCFGEKGKRPRGKTILAYDPFLLDKKTKDLPTEFEIDFISNKVRYIYGFSYDKYKIHHEKLEFYIGDKKELIYDLKLDRKDNLKQNFTNNFKGNKDRALEIFKNTKNNLFLSLNINEDGNNFLNPVYDWIAEKLWIKNKHSEHGFFETLEFIGKNKNSKNSILEIIKNIDKNIIDIVVEEVDLSDDLKNDQKIPDEIKNILQKSKGLRFITKQGFAFTTSKMSDGTNSLFGLCGIILPILQNGGVLFFDELERSLHPDALIYVVKMFHNPKINLGNGQIIFTAHNDILLEQDYNVFRRDQIWFAGKSEKDASTQIYSLPEFPAPTKKRENVVMKYRNNDYGARPNLKDFNW